MSWVVAHPERVCFGNGGVWIAQSSYGVKAKLILASHPQSQTQPGKGILLPIDEVSI